MTLQLTITPDGPTAPFEQVREQVSALARTGVLPIGYRLPTVRGLAAQLGLAANTVAKAYRALESDGVIETKGRNGTFVAAAGDSATHKAATAALAFAQHAHRLGLDREAAAEAAENAIRATYDTR